MKIGRQARIESSNISDSEYDSLRAFILVETESFVARALGYGDCSHAFYTAIVDCHHFASRVTLAVRQAVLQRKAS